MSGIVGIFSRDGAPVNPALLQALTQFQSFRGPDGQEVWLDGPIGFGHTMLRTTREAAKERQPASLGNRYWITADVRLDARAELIRELLGKGDEVERGEITDPELILHAYRAWGESCVDHLLGDFAFAILDAGEKKLFCARDHFGIKPFFYVVNEKQFIFSNTLNCLRAHPDVSDELNDAAIGDFLLFGLNCDVAKTTFSDILRLPPAHCLIVSPGQFSVRRFWNIPVDGRTRYTRPQQYVEHFSEILEASVGDRLRTDYVGIFLSGGMDSGSVAATASALVGSSDGAKELRAYTRCFQSLIVEEESTYARKTAEFLKISSCLRNQDALRFFERWDDPQVIAPEPVESPFFGTPVDNYNAFGPQFRVFLTGDGGDNPTQFQMWPHAKDLAKRGEWGILATETAKFLWVRRFPWRGIVARLSCLIGSRADDQSIASWMSDDFRRNLAFRERLRSDPARGEGEHPLLPEAYRSLTAPFWNLFFEVDDPGITRHAIEFRYPLMDVRIIEYLLSIPPFPWLFDKRIFREAMRSRLPEAVRTRPKTPLGANIFDAACKQSGDLSWATIGWSEKMSHYCERTKVPELSVSKDPQKLRLAFRTLSLNFWLQEAIPFRYKVNVGIHG